MDYLLRCWYFKICCLRLGFSCGDFDALQSSIGCSLCQWLSCKGPQFNNKRCSFHINSEKHWEDVPGCSPSNSLQNHQLFQSCNECTLNASWKLGDSWLTKVCQWTHRPIWSGVLGWDKLLWSCQCRERTELCSGHWVSWLSISAQASWVSSDCSNKLVVKLLRKCESGSTESLQHFWTNTEMIFRSLSRALPSPGFEKEKNSTLLPFNKLLY